MTRSSNYGRSSMHVFSRLILPALMLSLLLFNSCGEKADPTPEPTPKPSTSKSNILQELKVSEINGTALGSDVTLAGLVTNSVTGKPIVSLPVTDGYTYVLTDANGVYQMKRNPLSRKVYYSTPSEYQIKLDDKNHLPYFYSEKTLEEGKKYRVDFELDPLSSPEKEVTFLMIGDPQCATSANSGRYTSETIKDIKNTVSSGTYPNVYAMTLGDIIFDSNDMWSLMKTSMSNVSANGSYIPFFQTMGNHDHNALAFDGTESSETMCYKANAYFCSVFGPNDYSFNRGDVHVVVLDDVMPYAKSSSGKSNKWTCKYNSGLYDNQYNWLKQDLSYVQDKENKIIFVCMHIQIRGTTSNHMGDILNLCKQFKEAHIMIGHTHYNHNYIHTGYVCKGGKPIYEHIHGSACGGWWASNSNVTGSPNGYSIYTVKNGQVYDWQMKGTNRSIDFQLRAYNGNQTYTGTKGYVYNWYNLSNKGGSANIVALGNLSMKNSFVVEFFDDDATNCSVEFWQNGVKKGNFTRVADGKCANIAACSYFFNELGKNTDSWTSKTASHYWYYKPESGNPLSETGWEIKAIRKIPSSGISHTYTVNKLTTDYSTF